MIGDHGSQGALSRRAFLGTIGAGAAAAALGTRPQWRVDGAMKRLPSIGVQLYTIRKALERDLDGSLARVARIGYQEIELAGTYGHTAAQFRASLDRVGLRAPSSHLALEALRDHWDDTLRDAHTLGHEYLVCAWIDEQDRTGDGYKRTADAFNVIGERARAAGLGFAYHNHEWEFTRTPGMFTDAACPFDFLLAHTDPALVRMELDLYWVLAGGADPAAYLTAHSERFPMVHIKDRTKDGKMVDVGSGAIDWRTLLGQAAAAGCRHWFVEHDEPRDAFASVAASHRYLAALDVPGV